MGESRRPVRHARDRVEIDWTLGPEPPPAPGSVAADLTALDRPDQPDRATRLAPVARAARADRLAPVVRADRTDHVVRADRTDHPGNPPAPPTTLSLVISRRARREAAAQAAQAQQAIDPRIETIEKVLAGLQVAGNVFVLVLSAVGWLWLAAQREGRAQAAAGGTGPVSDSLPEGTVLGQLMPQSLMAASGATLVVIMLATCLLMAPVVNPFYAPPERRVLHATTTALFGLLALTTVAVIAGAAN